MGLFVLIDLAQFAVQLFLFYFLPGAVACAALLRGVKLSTFDRAAMSLMAGMLASPILLVLEYVLLGLKFNPSLVAANAMLVAIIGILGLLLQGSPFEFKAPEFPALSWGLGDNKALIARVLVFAIIILAFWVRLAPGWAYNFFEFDPIYYDHLTQMVVQDGATPLHSTAVYYPLEKNYRVYPLVTYLTAGWYSQYQSLYGGGFDKQALVLVSQIYPPLVGALMCFLAYMLVREEYGEFIGVIAAGIMAFTPNLIVKFGAGVNELQPFGLFSAVMLFTIYAMALSRRSYRMALLAGLTAFAAVLGSAQSIWPLMVVALFGLVYAVLAYWRGELDERAASVNLIVVASVLASYWVLDLYMDWEFGLTAQILLLLGSAMPALLFLAHKRISPNAPKAARKAVIAGFFALAAIIVLATPGMLDKLVGYVNATAGFARQISELTMTVAEENPTTPAQYFGSFAFLNPDLLLPLITGVVIIGSLLRLYGRGHRKAAIAASLVSVFLVVFNSWFDALLSAAVAALHAANLVYLVEFVSKSDVFIYMVLCVIALSIERIYIDDERLSYLPILYVIIVLPVAYIGLNKLKFLLHLALALALCLPIVLGLIMELSGRLARGLAREEDRGFAGKATLAVLFLAGMSMVFAQASTVGSSMNQLRYSRIPPDWMAAYEWMATTPAMSDAACIREYGFACRVLSWWDYGHWTRFFGEKQSVLDPGNEYPQFNHEVARSFVQGNDTDIRYSMTVHRATHILVDSDLIGKWGALVFLSGTCRNSQSPICPAVPDVNYSTNEGRAAYEAAHFYENLYPVPDAAGKPSNCPGNGTPSQMPALQSQLTGAIYCLGGGEYYLLTKSGMSPSYGRKYRIYGRDDFSKLDGGVSYLFATGSGSFINANPDLSYAGISNTFFNSAYGRLFFFGSMPGATLEYASPNGQVKIFKFSKDFYIK